MTYRFQFEKAEVVYFPKEEFDVACETACSLGVMSRKIDIALARTVLSDPCVRLAVFQIPWLPQPCIREEACFLYSQESSMVALDRFARSGSVSNDDIKDVLTTRFQNTVCIFCKQSFRTLVMDNCDGLFYSSDRLQERILATEILLCPVCRNSLRQLVVKIFSD
jgi:hypothetical protein